jgi:addiction module HigA family antidote
MAREIAPVSPGEMLQEEFLIPLGLSQYALAKAIGVPPRRINEIVHGTRAVTADTTCACAAISVCRMVGGCACRPSSTPNGRGNPWRRCWRALRR